jgi:hypothetical protein
MKRKGSDFRRSPLDILVEKGYNTRQRGELVARKVFGSVNKVRLVKK